MSESSIKFRQTALEQISSEQLNQLVQITTPKYWIILLTLWVLLLAVIIWGIFGTIPTRVNGTGILLAEQGSIFNATIPLSGSQVKSISVKLGDEVHENQAIAHLINPDIAKQLDVEQSYLQKLSSDQKQLQATAAEEIKNKQQNLAEEAGRLRLEGKEYIVKDGDVMHFRFNV